MKKEEKMNEPTFVYCDKPITDKVYVEWLSELKQRFQQSQIKAAVRVNTAMLEFYWGLGRDIDSDKILKDSPFSILQRPIEELKMPETFGLIPWGHHIQIVSKCQSLDEALYYINKVAEEGWSRSRLEEKPLGVATYQLQEVVDRTVAELELRKKQREELK